MSYNGTRIQTITFHYPWNIIMAEKKQQLLLGAHMSIAGGFHLALERGESIGCTAIQIFTKSNRQWAARKLTNQDLNTFEAARKQSPIKSIIAHATYLINIGSPNKDTCKKSMKALALELQRCDQLGILYLVLHPGSHLGTGEEECLQRIADNLNDVFDKTPGKTTILLETMAGQGSSVCYTFEHIAEILSQSAFKKRLGVCFDTCHAFVAGYDFRTKKTYEDMWKEFDKIIGLKKLKAIHINDSKKELGSHVDRHEDIGKGTLGLEPFKFLFNDERFFDIPKILETPKDDLKNDLKNIETIKKLISPRTKRTLSIE